MPEVREGEGDISLRQRGWSKSETVGGIPYYINHDEEITQWEHPRISEVFIQLDGMCDIKFGAYRTAMKLCTMRKMTHWNRVHCSMLEVAYKDVAIGPGPKHNLDTYSVEEVETLLADIFQYVNQERASLQFDVEGQVEVTLNYLLKCLDSGRTGKVKVRSLKNVLTVLACSSLEEKYCYLYDHVRRTGSDGISQSNLKALLLDLSLITDSIEEHTTFPPEHIDDAVKNCWDQIKNFEPTYLLSKKEFLDWMFKEPVCILWVPTMYRLTTAETIKHEAKCSKCKAYPIVGFRYRCLKCINVDLCQSCYWTQQTIKNHKITHPTREYCLATTTGDDVRDFAKQLKNKLTRKYKRRQPKVSYLKYPINEDAFIPEECPVLQNVHSRVNLLAGRLLEIEGSSERQPERLERDDTDSLSEVRTPAGSTSQPPLPMDQAIHFTLDDRERRRLEEQLEELKANQKTEERRRMDCEESLREVETAILEELKVKDGLESRVQHLESQKKTLEGRVAKLLRVPPMVNPVPTRVPPVVVMSPPVTERGVNTPSTSTLPRMGTMSQATSILGSEEEEMDAILKELLQAFPKQSRKVTADSMNSAVFQAGAAVRDSVSMLSQQMAKL